uniref:Ankyrin repeat-containing protein n=1 Tax=Borely moumouvirus TaxID=2712067 RepID=A0A6G6ADA6_9VIRU
MSTDCKEIIDSDELICIISKGDTLSFKKILDQIIDKYYILICYNINKLSNHYDVSNFIDILYDKLKNINNPSDIIVISVAYINKVDLIELVIENGGNINAIDNGCTPLIAACDFGNYNIIDYLLKNGANVDFQESPIFKFLCNTGKEKICSLLLDYGLKIDLNKTNDLEGFLYLIKKGNFTFLKLLVSHGIDFNPVKKYLNNKYEVDKNNEIIEVLSDLDFDLKHMYYIFN